MGKEVKEKLMPISDADKLNLLSAAEAALLDRGTLTEYPSTMLVGDNATHSEYGVEVTFASEDSNILVSVEIERHINGVWQTCASASGVPMLNYAALYPGQRRAQILATGIDTSGVYRAVVRVPNGASVVDVKPVLTPV